jgi:hypothetical protein
MSRWASTQMLKGQWVITEIQFTKKKNLGIHPGAKRTMEGNQINQFTS